MMVELQLWQLVSVLVTFLGGMIGGCKWMFDKIERRQADMFADAEERRASAQKQIEARIRALSDNVEELTRTGAAQAAAIARLPSDDVVSRVYDRLNASDSRTNRLDGAFQELATTVRGLLNHFIGKGVNS